MRHKKDITKFGRNKSHRKALMRNMAISFFQYQQIEKKKKKAKQLSKIVEKLITFGKKGDLAAYREINSFLNHPESLKQIKNIAEKYKDRNSGYTQIIKLFPRKGDGAEMAIIKLV